jgi:hypothetical protein
MQHDHPSSDPNCLGNYRQLNQPGMLQCIIKDNSRVVRCKSGVELNDIQTKVWDMVSEMPTHPGRFNEYALLVLSFEGITEETTREIECGCQHAIPRESSGDEKSVPKGLGITNWDSVRKTGNVFVAVKFFMGSDVGNAERE